MKRFLLSLMLLPLVARGEVQRNPATQAEVNAGVNTIKYVTPATLAGWTGGGSGGSTNNPTFTGRVTMSTNVLISGKSSSIGTIGLTNTFEIQNQGGTKTFQVNTGGQIYASIKILRDAANVAAFDWGNRYLNDTSGNNAIDWQNRIAYVSGGDSSLDWQNRQLIKAGGAPVLDWANSLLLTGGGVVTSVDWANRLLKDSSGSTTLDWQNLTTAGAWNFMGANGTITNTFSILGTANINNANVTNFTLFNDFNAGGKNITNLNTIIGPLRIDFTDARTNGSYSDASGYFHTNANFSFNVRGGSPIGITVPTNTGIILSNRVAATSGNPQNSPGITLVANGFSTGGSTNVPTRWTIYSVPISTVAIPTDSLTFTWGVSNNTPVTKLQINSAGQLTAQSDVISGLNVYAGGANTRGFTWNLSGSARIERSGSDIKILDFSGLDNGTNNLYISGSLTNRGSITATNGFASFATNAVMTVASTGATNSTGLQQIAWLTAATGLQLYDNNTNAVFSGTQTIAALTPIIVQPRGSFTGIAITSVGTHAF